MAQRPGERDPLTLRDLREVEWLGLGDLACHISGGVDAFVPAIVTHQLWGVQTKAARAVLREVGLCETDARVGGGPSERPEEWSNLPPAPSGARSRATRVYMTCSTC